MFFKDVYHFSNLCFSGDPSPTRIQLQDSYGFRTCTLFEKNVFSRRVFSKSIKHQLHFRIVFSLIFITFSTHIFAQMFISFLMENGSQMAPKNNPAACLFGSLFATFSEDPFLDAFWSPFSSLLAPFGSLLAPLGSLLAPFGSLLAPFGSFWLPFGSLWAPFSHFG